MDELFQLTSKDMKNKIDTINENVNKVISKKILPSKKSYKIEAKIIYEDKNQMSSKQKVIKKRNSGVDLIRMVTMLGIVYTHILFHGKGVNKYSKYKKKLINSHTYVFWHNNAFALISGVVGYKSTKYSNLLYLWLCVVFYSVGIHYYYLKCKQITNVNGELYKEYYPAIYGRYWYFSSYFGMFIFLPAINKGLQCLNKSEFKLLVMSILGIFVFWINYINNKVDVFKICGGISTIWLLCLYIIGAYIGKFNLDYKGIKRYIICLNYLLIFLFLCFIYNKFSDSTISYNNEGFQTKFRDFIEKLMSNNLNSVIKTAQAILITLFFLQLKYNDYLSKIITFFGPLSFGVYLIHINHNVIINYLGNILKRGPNNLAAGEVMQYLIFKSIILFIECIIIEYLRHLLFTILKIRKICMFIEKIVFKIVS